MRIDILVVIAVRKVSILCGKSSPTCIALTRPTVTVATPVFKRPQDAKKSFVGRHNRTAFAKCYVVSWVERECGDVTEGTGVFPSIGGTQGIAVVFNKEEVMPVLTIFIISSRLNGLPRVCAMKIARVFSLIAASISSSFALYVGISTSTNTGTRPFRIIGFRVVGKPAAMVITSSPAFNRRSFNK